MTLNKKTIATRTTENLINAAINLLVARACLVASLGYLQGHNGDYSKQLMNADKLVHLVFQELNARCVDTFKQVTDVAIARAKSMSLVTF